MSSSQHAGIASKDEMKRINNQSIRNSLDNVPGRTKRSYQPKQREFIQFCIEKSYDDGIIVYSEKLVHFLDQKVFCSR
jgi:hypothetical protein